ncbi:MAG: glycosyltransferase family 4 protein [Phycisphaeraceae bacterium]|nr:glycosyltransferase family 4 protein [Phycisphaeraceae bacterium]
MNRPPLRFAFVLPGLHAVSRGAETALEALGAEIGRRPDARVTLFGRGQAREKSPYDFVTVPARPREKYQSWPRLPGLRSPEAWEDLSFSRQLKEKYNVEAFDVTVTCNYPWSHWTIQRRTRSRHGHVHLFVTENGDWPAFSDDWEFRFFHCDGLVCTNPVYHERNRERWPSALIPNGFDPERFHPGPGDPATIGMDPDLPLVLMVSALTDHKRVREGMAAVATMDEPLQLLVAGDGPLRSEVEALGERRFGDRFACRRFDHTQMGNVYRCADVLLHPCLDEPSAHVYVEAMASGLPVITHDHPTTRWTLGERDHLVDARQTEAMADALGTALAGAEKMPDGEFEKICERFAWRRLADRYVEFARQRLECGPPV